MSKSLPKPSIEEHEGEILVRLRVQPKSSRNVIHPPHDDDPLRVSLTAPPIDGEANKALRALLSKALKIPKSAITLRSGTKAREKTVAIVGLSLDTVRKRLSLS